VRGRIPVCDDIKDSGHWREGAYEEVAGVLGKYFGVFAGHPGIEINFLENEFL